MPTFAPGTVDIYVHGATTAARVSPPTWKNT